MPALPQRPPVSAPPGANGHTPHHFVHHGAFGDDRFGAVAERFARFFGTPRFIIGQTVLVVLWIAANSAAFGFRWDPYPFILLNLAFSTQAAYAAPLILLAATREADRDKLRDSALQELHDAEIQRQQDVEARQLKLLARERKLSEQHLQLLVKNTELTEQIARLTTQLHETLCGPEAHAARLPGSPESMRPGPS
jgi:uncharacterized membrane protein